MKKKLSKKERLLRYRKQSRLPKYDIAMKKTSTGAQDFTYNPVQTSLTPGVDISGDIKSAKQKILPDALSTAVSTVTLPGSLSKGLEGIGFMSAKEFNDKYGMYKTIEQTATNLFKNQAGNVTQDALKSSLTGVGTETTKLGVDSAAKIAETAAKNGVIDATSGAVGSSAQEFGKNTAEAAAQTGAASSASSGLTTALGVANILASVYNTGKLIGDTIGMRSNVRSVSDIIDSTSRQTAYRNGVAYERRGGIAAEKERDYLKQQNTSSTIKNTLTGAGAGMATAGAIGAAAGSVVPGIGTAIGAAAGAIVGGLTSLFGASSAKRALANRLDRAALAIEGSNRQNESLAGTQGLRQQFYQTHAGNSGYLNADRGYNPPNGGIESYDEVGRPEGKTKVVWTPEGKRVDKQGSWVGKGESLIDYTTGKATVVKEGKVGVDNQPSSAKEGDTVTIVGNDVNWKTGNTFAREVAPYALMIEGLNKTERAIQNSKASQKTKEINMLNLKRAKEPYLNAAKQLTDQQDMQHKIENMYGQQMNQYALPNYNWGKFWQGTKKVLGKIGTSLGKGANGIAQYAPYLMNAMAATKQYYDYKNSTPTARNSYVANAYAPSALNALASLYYDPSTELSAARDAYRNQLYLNNNAGSLSAGQRAMLNNALSIGLMKSRSAILQNAQNKMNEYKEKYATQALTTGNEEAARRQNALAAYNTQLANAYAARLKGMETAQKSLGNIFEMFGKHVFDSDQYRKALGIQERHGSLYDNQYYGNKGE